MKKYIIAGCIIILIGIILAINAYINKDSSDILLGISFVLLGVGYFFKKDK